MIGTIPKRVDVAHLQCAGCTQFRDNDPDLYYCALDCRDFPGLCEQYKPRKLEYIVLDEDDGNLD